MNKRKDGKKLNVIRTISPVPMSEYDFQQVQSILATWIARAYAADHPELFGPKLQEVLDKEQSSSG
jgi:hypothetical protein